MRAPQRAPSERSGGAQPFPSLSLIVDSISWATLIYRGLSNPAMTGSLQDEAPSGHYPPDAPSHER